MPYDLGDTVRLETVCRDAGGTATTAATAVLTLTLPDGTTATPAVPVPAQAGQYRVDYITAQAGRHAARWVFTTPSAAYTDAFDVREAVPPMLLSLADTKRHLRITATDTDDDLRSWIESATGIVESLVGPCVRQPVVETHAIQPSGTRLLALRRTPALSLTSAVAVLDGGTGYTVADLDLDGTLGMVRRLDGGRFYGTLRVTYVVGRTVIPAVIRDAGKIIIQHLWRTQHGASRAGSGLGGGDDYSVSEPYPGFGYAVPNRALQLLEPHRLPPGVG